MNRETVIDVFFDEIKNCHNMSDLLLETLKDTINKSECRKIEFADFKFPVFGVALDTGVIINRNVLNKNLEFLIFVIFHELAHQFQYKKYGADAMYNFYVKDMNIYDAAKGIQKFEMIADEFAIRKIRELQKKGLINKNYKPVAFYKNMSLHMLTEMLTSIKQIIKNKDINTNDDISECFYNLVKFGIN